MKNALIVVLACTALAACATRTEWKKEGISQDKKEADLMACRSEMNRFSGAVTQEVFAKCMSGRGYEPETAYGER